MALALLLGGLIAHSGRLYLITSNESRLLALLRRRRLVQGRFALSIVARQASHRS
jgi:hypothetical protein